MRGTTKTMGIKLTLIMIILAIGLGFATKNEFIYRVVYNQAGFSRNPENLYEHIRMAGRSGYNAMVACEWVTENLEEQPQKVIDNFKKAEAIAKTNGIKLIPWHFYQQMGAHENYNLAETFPVKGTKFVVSGKEARAVGDHEIGLKNGGFEAFTGTTPDNWHLSYLPGSQCVMDKVNKKSGVSSLLVRNAPRFARIKQTVKVKPFRAYQISAWFKTDRINSWVQVQFGVDPGMLHRRERPFGTPKSWTTLSGTQSWRKSVIDFNSLRNTTATISLWFTYTVVQGGNIWVDDIQIREVGLYETVRNEVKPIVVKSTDGKTTYKEGTDYVVDPKCNNFHETAHNNTSYNYEGHLKIPAGSTIKNGQELRVDWFQYANVETIVPESDYCLPKVWSTLEDNLTRIDDLFGNSDAMWCNIDEWRVGAWNPNCQTFKYKAGGDYMARTWEGIECLLRKNGNGCRTVFTWNDMFDPYHNSWHTYAMVNGGTWQAWAGLSNDVIIGNWNGKYAEQSLRFFAGLDTLKPKVKCRQILNTLDAGGVSKWINILEKAEKDGAEGIVGISWVTWRADYSFLPQVAAACKARGRWPTNPFPVKSCAPVNKCKGFDPAAGIDRKTSPSIAIPSAQILATAHSPKSIRIEYSVPEYRNVTIKAYDVRGRQIHTLVSRRHEIGAHHITWNTSNFAPGVYFLRLDVDGVSHRTIKQTVF